MVTTSGAPIGEDPPASAGYQIERTFHKVDGTKIDPSKVRQTDRLVVVLKVTEAKADDLSIRQTVTAHRSDGIYLNGVYRGQVNGEIKAVYNDMGRFEELSDIKYTDVAGIFDIMAMTVIQHHLHVAA